MLNIIFYKKKPSSVLDEGFFILLYF